MRRVEFEVTLRRSTGGEWCCWEAMAKRQEQRLAGEKKAVKSLYTHSEWHLAGT